MTDWPNPLVVSVLPMYRIDRVWVSDVAIDGRVLIVPKREAYMYPTTDESKEPFHWGFPKLSALRAFLHEELSWSISKVDDELTPIVQRIARRGKVSDCDVSLLR